MLRVKFRHAFVGWSLFSVVMISLVAGCKSEDPTLTAAPPTAANAVPAKPVVNKDRGEAATTATTSTQAGEAAAPAGK